MWETRSLVTSFESPTAMILSSPISDSSFLTASEIILVSSTLPSYGIISAGSPSPSVEATKLYCTRPSLPSFGFPSLGMGAPSGTPSYSSPGDLQIVMLEGSTWYTGEDSPRQNFTLEAMLQKRSSAPASNIVSMALPRAMSFSAALSTLEPNSLSTGDPL